MSEYSKHNTNRFRDVIASILGLASNLPLRRLSPSDRAFSAGSHIGIHPSWSFITRSHRSVSLGEVVDEARAAADHEGKVRFAGVLPRPGADPSKAFVVTELGVLIDLLAEEGARRG